MTKKEKYVALIKDINAKHKSKNKVLEEIKVPTKRRERLSAEDELKLVYVCSNTDSIEEIEELRKKYHMRDSFTTVCDECNVSMSISDTQITTMGYVHDDMEARKKLAHVMEDIVSFDTDAVVS
ncbi:MAG: hypothetical protein ACI4DP_03215 [Candidatus Ornithomonoglobus sp.]